MNTCEAKVGEPPHYFHWHQCTRKAKWVVNGTRQCTQHLNQWERNARITGQKLTIKAAS